MTRSESFPCLVCGRALLRDLDEYEAQPDDGVMCSTTGNYGSTVYDAMDLSYVAFNICDPCFVEAGEMGRLFTHRTVMPVTMPPFGRVGATRAIDRPYLKWTRGFPDDESSLIVYDLDELADLVERGQVELHGGLTVDGLREGLASWEPEP